MQQSTCVHPPGNTESWRDIIHRIAHGTGLNNRGVHANGLHTFVNNGNLKQAQVEVYSLFSHFELP